MQVVINGQYSITGTGSSVGSDTVEYNHPENGWTNASYSNNGIYSFDFDTTSPAGTPVSFRLNSVCCELLTVVSPSSVAIQDNNVAGFP